MANEFEIPELKDELNRKTIDTLANIERRVETGEYSERDRVIAFDTINEVTLGLIDNDISTVLTENLAQLRFDMVNNQVQQVLISPAGVVTILKLDYIKDQLSIGTIHEGSFKTKTKELDPLSRKTPMQVYGDYVLKLLDNGYKLVA